MSKKPVWRQLLNRIRGGSLVITGLCVIVFLLTGQILLTRPLTQETELIVNFFLEWLVVAGLVAAVLAIGSQVWLSIKGK